MIDLGNPIQSQLDAIKTDAPKLYEAASRLAFDRIADRKNLSMQQHDLHEAQNALSVANDRTKDLAEKLLAAEHALAMQAEAKTTTT